MNSAINNNFCTYVHKDSDGIVRYIGGARVSRANNTNPNTNRGILYAEFVKRNGRLIPEIVESNLTKIDAAEKAAVLYSKYNHGNLLNAYKPKHIAPLPNKDGLDAVLYYDESSPSGLRWKIASGRNVKDNAVAGSFGKDGYWKIQVFGVSYKAHRIILVLHGFDIKETDIIDHLDNDRSNNKISNIAISTYAGNGRNKIRGPRNPELPIGVTFRSIKGVDYFVATVTDPIQKTKLGQSKLIRKHFRVSKYGEESALTMAIDTRKTMLTALEEIGDVSYSKHHK